MFASQVQIAENGMAQRQYKATMGNKFPSKTEALTSESTLSTSVDTTFFS